MSDVILLEPQQAGQTLMEMQATMKAFIAEIDAIAEILRAVSTITFSTPLTEVFQVLANALTDIGNAVNEAVDNYCQAFTQVIETWKQTDMTAASSISFAKPGFDGVTISITESIKVQVEPGKVHNLMDQHQQHGQRMGQHFQKMNDEINRSGSYWIGQSGDLTRQAWMSHVMPLADQVAQLMAKVLELIGSELDAFLRRDASNYVA